VVAGFAGRGRTPAACCWARTIVESTETAQLRSQFIGHDAVSVAAWTLTATWQFARLSTAPQY
jgi:hypothetical protein